MTKPTARQPRRKAGSTTYEGIRERASAHILAESRKGRDIAPCPRIKSRKRRDACSASLKTFLEACFEHTFTLPWCDDHLTVIDRLETVIGDGGQFALAMPRGSGKTSIVERAALWAILTGRRRFVVIVAANESLAVKSLGRIKTELEHNAALLGLWPKAVYPIKRLESQSRRAVGQLFNGARTRIDWQRKSLVMPTMPGPSNEASGAVLHAGGLLGGIRGLSAVDPDGATIRPDLVLVDDPQDRESAASVVQTSQRMELMNGDLLGLGGPGKAIAAVATCTVIHRGDLADQLLDREKSPAWTGERFKMMDAMPDDVAAWDEYALIRKRDGAEAATAHYVANREAMDAGAVAAWPERFESGEASAVQHAMNIKLDRGPRAFASEYQNAPLDERPEADALDPVAIAKRTNGLERGTAPADCETVVAFIDVGQTLLWWLVVGWSESFTGSVLDYGVWPEQRSRRVTAANADPALERVYRGAGGVDGVVYAGLHDLVSQLFDRVWARADGATLPLGRLMVDAGWKPDAVRTMIAQHPRRDAMLPSKGFGRGPQQAAIADYRRRPGERIGVDWIIGAAGADRLRLLRFDANAWKSRVAGMMSRPPGVSGGLSLFGDDAYEHELVAHHLASEYPTPTTAGGVTLDVWTRHPDRENHWLDCLVGCAVAASVGGVAIPGVAAPTEKRRKRYKR